MFVFPALMLWKPPIITSVFLCYFHLFSFQHTYTQEPCIQDGGECATNLHCESRQLVSVLPRVNSTVPSSIVTWQTGPGSYLGLWTYLAVAVILTHPRNLNREDWMGRGFYNWTIKLYCCRDAVRDKGKPRGIVTSLLDVHHKACSICVRGS